ncbi:TonB-dependent receptor [Longimicrobium sp.]|uniref:TonB-dependent receptor n=1 Tax=Longimicrobium sp. TaxID=2029185 RepID=UPI003B3A6E15
MLIAIESRVFARPGVRHARRATGRGLWLGVVLMMCILCAPLLSAQTTAGTVTGRVIDAGTNEPVPGARVTVEDGAARTVTGADGTYRLAGVPSGRRSIGVRALGYGRLVAEVDVPAGGEARRDFGLAVAAMPLDELVVTGTTGPTEVRAIPNTITVLTAEQIERRGVTQVQDLFRGDVPGLFSAEAAGGAATDRGSRVRLYSRGGSNLRGEASPPKVYVDGVLLTDPSQLNVIDPRSIERVEFVPGPQASTLYGSGAINGVMQIFLKKGSFGAPRPRVTVEASAGTVQNSFDDRIVAAQNHHLEVSGARASTTYTLGVSWQSEGPWIPRRDEERLGFNGGMRMELGRFTADAAVRYGRLSFDGSSRPFEAGEVREGRRRLDNPLLLFGTGLDDRWTQRAFSLNLNYAATPWWRHQVTAGYDSRRAEGRTPPGFSFFSDSLYTISESDGSATTLRYASTMDVPLRGAIRPTLTAGIEYNGVTNVSSSGLGTLETGPFEASSFGRVENSTTGFFAQSQVSLWDAVFLTAGVRAEDDANYGPEYGTSVSPRVGASIVRDLGALTLKVRGAWGRATNPPDAEARLDVFSTDLSGQRIRSRLGNPEIGPETQQGTEWGVEMSFDARTLVSLSLTGYRQTADDLIDDVLLIVVDSTFLDDLGNPLVYPQVQTVNLGRVRNTGWEAQGRAVLGAFTMRGAFGTSKSRVLRLNNPEDQRYAIGRALIGPAQEQGSLDVSYTGRRLRGGIRVLHVGSVRLLRNDLLQEGATRARSPRLSPRTWDPFNFDLGVGSYTAPSYRLVDLDAGWRLMADADLFVRVFNALDYYRNDVVNTGVARGRRTLAGVRVTF